MTVVVLIIFLITEKHATLQHKEGGFTLTQFEKFQSVSGKHKHRSSQTEGLGRGKLLTSWQSGTSRGRSRGEGHPPPESLTSGQAPELTKESFHQECSVTWSSPFPQIPP